MADKFKPIFALVAALLAATTSAQGLPLELKQTAGGGWRFGNEAIAVSLSSKTGWPVEWNVDGKRVLSGGKTPDTPWGVVFNAIDHCGVCPHLI